MNVTHARYILGVSTDRPSPDELRGAWRRFARENHPDRRPQDPEAARRFAVGRDAYDALLNGDATAAGPSSQPPESAATREHRPREERARGPRVVVRGPAAWTAQPYAFPDVAAREWQA